MDLFNKIKDGMAGMTLPQSILLGTFMLSCAVLCSSAFEKGIAPDIDFSNKRIRFDKIDKGHLPQNEQNSRLS